jgi:PGDYG protein
MPNLSHLINLELDSAAAPYCKKEIVKVHFAIDAGILISRVGPNHYVAGDAIVDAVDGETWVVSRRRFDDKYLPMPPTLAGEAGSYEAKKMIVLAKQMADAFSIAREVSGDMLMGCSGDWLIQYAPGDFGVVLNQRFQRIYRRVD